MMSKINIFHLPDDAILDESTPRIVETQTQNEFLKPTTIASVVDKKRQIKRIIFESENNFFMI